MSNDSRVLKRGTAACIIASVCVLTALFQVVAGLVIFNQVEGRAWLSTADSVMRGRVLLPLGIAVCLNLAAGVAVYLMRVEAFACMGYLLTGPLARLIGPPFQLLGVLDLSFLLVLTYFTMRLFAQSSALHAKAPSGWRHPLAMLFAGLTAGHLAVLVKYLQAYPTLVSNGSVPPLLALAALIGCGAFYAAVMMMQSRPDRAKKFFLLGALAMGLSLPGWSFRYGFATPFWMGMLLAMLGFGLVRYLRAR